MNVETAEITARSLSPSKQGRQRISGVWGEPLFYADWLRAVFIHYEVDAEALQREVPFELDLREGRAYVSLVAFTMRNMRPMIGGRLGALLFRPIATHGFLNVRAYVRDRGEPGIYFLAEWLSNPLSVRLGPMTFGLPYRRGRLVYQHTHEQGQLHGTVTDQEIGTRLEYEAEPGIQGFQPCDPGSLDEFLMERYTAFTFLDKQPKRCRGPAVRRLFRIWHPPWPQTPISVRIKDDTLLTALWPWFKDARLIGANYSPGVHRVWMGRPQRIKTFGDGREGFRRS